MIRRLTIIVGALCAALAVCALPARAADKSGLKAGLRRIDSVIGSDRARAGRMLDELRAEFPNNGLSAADRMQLGVRLVQLQRLGEVAAVLNSVAGERGSDTRAVSGQSATERSLNLEARIAAVALVGRIDEAAALMKECANAAPPAVSCGVFRAAGLVRKFHRPNVAMGLLKAFGERKGLAAPHAIPAQQPTPTPQPAKADIKRRQGDLGVPLTGTAFDPSRMPPAHDSPPWWVWAMGVIGAGSIAVFWMRGGGWR